MNKNLSALFRITELHFVCFYNRGQVKFEPKQKNEDLQEILDDMGSRPVVG